MKRGCALLLVWLCYSALPVGALSQPSYEDASSRCPSTDSLTVRNAHALAYGAELGAVVLYGGADERQVLGDLWAWDGQIWRCLSPGGPPARTFPALAYDDARQELVLFGGNRVLFGTAQDTAGFLDDMWTWDGAGWNEEEAATPTARAEAAMTFDAGRQRIVLFGGYRNEGDHRIRLGDTWEWDGRRWERKAVHGPHPRNGAAMAYDTDRKRVVLFGGSGNAGDTWEWDGESWHHVASADTPARFNPAMSYDAADHALIRFGGWTSEGRVGDTWRYDGSAWTKVADAGPAPRNHTATAYDPKRGVVVLFGGHDGDRVFGDTWEWRNGAWVRRAGPAPRRRVDNGH